MNAAHLHLLVNHAGLFATLFGGALLGVGMYWNQKALVKAGLLMAVVAAVAAIAAVQTGEGAEEIVEHLAGVSESAIAAHEEAAELAQVTSIVLGILAGIALLGSERWPTIGRLAVIGAFGMTMAVFGATAYAANLGGRIRHAEVVPELADTPSLAVGESSPIE